MDHFPLRLCPLRLQGYKKGLSFLLVVVTLATVGSRSLFRYLGLCKSCRVRHSSFIRCSSNVLVVARSNFSHFPLFFLHPRGRERPNRGAYACPCAGVRAGQDHTCQSIPVHQLFSFNTGGSRDHCPFKCVSHSTSSTLLSSDTTKPHRIHARLLFFVSVESHVHSLIRCQECPHAKSSSPLVLEKP